MTNITRNVGRPEYISSASIGTEFVFTYFSIKLTFNGEEREYEEINTSLAFLDLSNNAFQGEIPDSIGQLVSVYGLNLSHNQLTGFIPRSLSNLTLLNCLDLSSNTLTRQIPQELVSLTSMEVFNVSENQLVGPIPHGKQFDTFSMDSYKENPGLCGFPLPECREHVKPMPQPSRVEPGGDDSDDVGMLSECTVIMMGYGCGTLMGIAWGYYMLSIGRPFWLVELVHLIVLGPEK